jgi:hypothetical protein
MASQPTISFASSDKQLLTTTPPGGPPLQIFKEGRIWEQFEHLPNRGKGSFASKVWDLGTEYRAADDGSKRAWRCSLCIGDSLAILSGNSTSPAHRHLKKKHKLLLGRESTDNESSYCDSDLSSTVTDGLELPIHRSLVHSVNINQFRYHLLRWIVNRQLAFTEVEDDDFRAMLSTLSQSISPYLVGGDTIRNWALDEYLRANDTVKQLLANAKSRVHISFDLWTSPHQLAICAVVAHFVSPQYRNISVLLGMKKMKGAHGGENIAEVVIPVLEEYHIGPRLGVFVADNVESNDTAIRAIMQSVRPEIRGETRRSRCLGHIINLAAKSFLFGKNVEAFEGSLSELGEGEDLGSEGMQAAQKAWREKGPIGKFHNVVVFIRSSPQRREAFGKILSSEGVNDGELSISHFATRSCEI